MISRQNFILLFICFLICLSCNNSDNLGEVYQPVNVILITADDLNYNSLGCYGNTLNQITPNIDKLAESGILFTNAFVNIAVCQPSRQSILTGRYPHNNGAPAFNPIARDVVTLQEVLEKAGYLNGILGKEIHLKPTEKFRWDYYITEEDLASGLGIGREPELYFEFSTEFFNKAKMEGKPFFLMANSHDPHRLCRERSREKRMGRGSTFNYQKILPDEVTVPDFLPDLPEVRLEIAEYYTSVYRLDQTVGAIMDALKNSGQEANTLVMFISDNGMALPFAKSNCYLNSNKTPWLVRWPSVIEGGRVDSTHFISGIDFMPTILNTLRLPPVSEMDGTSFLPVLEGKTQKKQNNSFHGISQNFCWDRLSHARGAC